MNKQLVSKSYKKDILFKNINKMHNKYYLLMKLKNIPNEIIDIIMKNIVNNEKNLKLDYTTNYSKIIIKQNKNNEVKKSIAKYLYIIEREENYNNKKEKVIQLFDYLINNSYFINKRRNLTLAKVVKSKIKELIIEIKNSNESIDIALVNKLNESNQKIFGLNKINLCKECNNNVCSIKYNYNLCFNHLFKKFSF